MVLIAWMMACMHAVQPTTSVQAPAVAMVMTLAAPEDAEALTAPNAAKQAVQEALTAAGHSVSQEIDAGAIQALGTASAQLASAIDAAAGSTVVLITTTARPRGELAGRYPWEISVRLTVAKAGAEPMRQEFNLPVSLSHIHQGPEDALEAAAPRIARRARLAVSRYHRGQQ